VELRGRFVPTARNQPVATFYQDQGFLVLDRRETGETLYLLRRGQVRKQDCHWIEVVQDEMALGLR
jgi:predicted enzyme involved in methoxymalonyl-ACP biosynthesis